MRDSLVIKKSLANGEFLCNEPSPTAEISCDTRDCGEKIACQGRCAIMVHSGRHLQGLWGLGVKQLLTRLLRIQLNSGEFHKIGNHL